MFLKKSIWKVEKSLVRAARANATTATVQNVRSMPGDNGLPLIGTLPKFLASGGTTNFHLYIDNQHKKFGPIYKESIGPVKAIFLSDPKEVRAVFAKEGKYPMHFVPDPWVVYDKVNNAKQNLFTMDGEEWWSNRKIFNKFLMKGDLSWTEKCSDLVTGYTVQHLKEFAQSGKEVHDLDRILYDLTTNAMIAIIAGSNSYDKVKPKIEPIVNKIVETVQEMFIRTIKLTVLPANLARILHLPAWTNLERCITETYSLSGILIEELIRNLPEDSNGLLKKLEEDRVPKEIYSKMVGDLVLGAGDSTSHAIQWLLYAISTHQSCQEKLRAELKLNKNPTYLRNIFKETLRLYPVAPFLSRYLPEDAVIAGYKIPARTLIIMSIYTSGRSEKNFKNPTEFNPDRWDRQQEEVTSQQASIPFAIGSRACVGKKIAEYQSQVTLAKIVENFNVTLCNTNPIRPILKMITTPSEPLRLKLSHVK